VGPLLAGLLSQWAGSPLRLTFWVYLALLVPAAIGIWAMPEPVVATSRPRLRPQALTVPTEMRTTFVEAALAGFAGFVILGNTSSGGAVSPPLLPAPFAFISQWLPSGATVTALRDAVYFRADLHVRPIAVLAVWALTLFVAWLIVAGRREASAAAA
jgi:hypothetical protein